MLYLLACGVLLLAVLSILEHRRHDRTVRDLTAEHAARVTALQDRHDQAVRELTARHADQTAEHAADATAQRREFLEHIANLYQRIQAPQAAVIEHHAQVAGPSMPAVIPDDDDSYWQAQQMSKEALAELALAEELAHRAPHLVEGAA